jgi:RNA polymerase sigma-70 factor (ECF subfamily)
MQPTRQTLLERMRDPKAERAWEEFYQMYWVVIVRYAQKQGLDETSAHDVLQETMVALLRQMAEFRYDPGKGKFRNFLLTIVHRKTLSALRRAHRKVEVSLDEPISDDDTFPVERVADEAAVMPFESVENQWLDSIREEALRRIQADPRVQGQTFDVFRAYVIEQQPVEAVAGKFGIKPNAVYQIKNRMIKRLKDEVAMMTANLEE